MNCPEPGLYENVPYDVYRNWDAVNFSTLNMMRRSPAHARSEMLAPKESTPAMVLGNLIHTALLQPHVFADTCVVMPDFTIGLLDPKTKKPYGNPRNSNPYKAKVAEFKEANQGKQIVAAKDYQLCVDISRSIREHPSAGLFVESATMFELSAVWVDEKTGLLCKARIDSVIPEFDALGDLKSTRDASREFFSRSIFDYGYHIQGAMYRRGARANGIHIEHYAITAVEKKPIIRDLDKPPYYPVGLYRLKDEELAFGEEMLDELMAQYKQCRESGIWQCYSDEPEDIGLPEWALRRARQAKQQKIAEQGWTEESEVSYDDGAFYLD